MASQYEQLFLHRGLNEGEREAQVTAAVEFLNGSEHDYRWELMQKGLERASNAIREGRPVLYYMVDDTSAGGRHAVEAVFSPRENTAFIGYPISESEQKGYFPTILHTLEFITETVQAANNDSPNTPKIAYPGIYFKPNDHHDVWRSVTQRMPDVETVMVPLIVNPEKTNTIFIHTQTRKIDPLTLSKGYYEVIKQDPNLVGDLMRHTMLVHAVDKSVDQPPNKRLAYVRVLPHEQAKHLPLVNLSRVQPWQYKSEQQIPPGDIHIVSQKGEHLITTMPAQEN